MHYGPWIKILSKCIKGFFPEKRKLKSFISQFYVDNTVLRNK